MNLYKVIFETKDPDYEKGFYSVKAKSFEGAYEIASYKIVSDLLKEKLLVRVLIIYQNKIVEEICNAYFERIKDTLFAQLDTENNPECCSKYQDNVL